MPLITYTYKTILIHLDKLSDIIYMHTKNVYE